MNCFASAPRGAEHLVAGELLLLGISNVSPGRGGVSFVTDRAGLYRANLWLRCASRVLLTLAMFPCVSKNDLYEGVIAVPWHEIITPDMTLSVDCSLRGSALTHSGFVALKTKDAVVDRIRSELGSRPSVDTASPNVRINVHLANNVCTLSLDSSGEALDRRGYRLERNEAPLRETLAAAVIALTGWDGTAPIVDPMCGSGSIPIEAALLASRIPPGRNRSFGFQRWLDFDPNLWKEIRSEAEAGIRPLPPGFVTGCDMDANSLVLARRNATAAGFGEEIALLHNPFESFRPVGEGGVIIVNPPYGKRMGEEEKLKELYRRIGDIFKQRCKGRTAYVLTGNLELAKFVGLKVSRRFELFNGPIECRLLKYELY